MVATRDNWAPSKRQMQIADQERLWQAVDVARKGLPPSASSQEISRARVLDRLNAVSQYAEATMTWPSMIQAEVKIGEHLGMFNDKGRSDEITLALVSALREAHARLPIAPAPTLIEHRELPEQAT